MRVLSRALALAALTTLATGCGGGIPGLDVLFGGGQSTARPEEITVNAGNTEYRYEFRYNGDNTLDEIETSVNGTSVGERRFQWDNGVLTGYDDRPSNEHDIDVEFEREGGDIVSVKAEGDWQENSVTTTASLDSTLEREGGVVVSIKSDADRSSSGEIFGFAFRETVNTDDERTITRDGSRFSEIEIRSEQRSASYSGDDEEPDSESTTIVKTTYQFEYADDGSLEEVEIDTESQTDDNDPVTDDDRYVFSFNDEGKLADIEQKGGSNDYDWDLDYDDEGRVEEITTVNYDVEIDYEDGNVAGGVTISLGDIMPLGQYFDLAGNAHVNDIDLEHISP